ncbi:MAG TPA: alanine racemase [Nitrospira sp.]|nr:alanine racemase [Nitrospira sp.]
MLTTSTFLPTSATVDLTALVHNLAQFRNTLVPGCDVMTVVKANAYGHGAVETAKALIRQGVSRVAVVSIEEGIALRQAGINAPIVILGPLFPEQFTDLFAHQLTPVVSDAAILPKLAQVASSFQTPYPIHLKVDTGMGRLGLTQEEVAHLFSSKHFPRTLHLEGLMTHLADADGADTGATQEQLTHFRNVIGIVTANGFRVPLIHAANSGGAIRFPDAHFSLVRPGIMLYGYHTLPKSVPVPDLKPVLSLRTSIAQLRTIQPGQKVSYNGTFTATQPTKIAVLPIGYADGISRRLSNRGQVLIHGQRAPIAGLVCMDMIMVDVTKIAGAAIGDEAVLIGSQGADRITAEDIANWTGTIAYEVLCTIGPRIPRQYRSSS